MHAQVCPTMPKRRVVVLVGSTLDGGAPDGTGGNYSGTLDSVDPSIAGMFGDDIEILSYEEAIECADAEAVMAFSHAHVDAALLDALGPCVKVVSNYGVGVNHIDLQECRRRNIPVGNTPGVLSDATADLAWALLLACARRVPECDAYTRSPAFKCYENMLLLGADVTGATLGIVGMGRIGAEVARRAVGFRMRTLYTRRTRCDAETEASLNASYVSLDTLLAESDFVCLVCPLTHETSGLIGAEAFSKMKPSSVLINVARGGVVDQDALLAALAADDGSGIAMAGLDVSTPEPLPRDHPLLSRADVVWTPHRGSATAGTRRAMAEMMLRNMWLGLEGKPLESCCN